MPRGAAGTRKGRVGKSVIVLKDSVLKYILSVGAIL